MTVPVPDNPSWFHVHLGKGLLRQANRFNLQESEVIERFVRPWAAGEQVSVDGKAFSPTEAKMTIYAGQRLTTSQMSMGQGWSNAIKFGEDVTAQLLAGGWESPATAVTPNRDPRAVAVFHGRDEEAREAVFDFLQDLDLNPLGWGELVAGTGSASPYTGDVVEVAFELAQAVVVLFTPDDEARLHPDLWGDAEPETEQLFTTQPRANVILEAGMALLSHPDETVLLEIGRVRPISNLAGRNVVRMTSRTIVRALNDLATRLETARCPVNRKSGDWLSTERFETLPALERGAAPAKLLPAITVRATLLKHLERGRSLLAQSIITLPDSQRWAEETADFLGQYLNEEAAEGFLEARAPHSGGHEEVGVRVSYLFQLAEKLKSG